MSNIASHEKSLILTTARITPYSVQMRENSDTFHALRPSLYVQVQA